MIGKEIQKLLDLSKEDFCNCLKKMSIPELEEFIEEFCRYGGYYNYRQDSFEKLENCLKRRKTLLNEMIECTPENLKRIRAVIKYFDKEKKILVEKGKQLHTQMQQHFLQKEDDIFSNFYIKLLMTVSGNSDHEDSILHLPDDHSHSNYLKMAECLSKFYYKKYNERHSFELFEAVLHYKVDIFNQIWDDEMDYKRNKDTHCWSYSCYGDKFPELWKLPVDGSFHDLFGSSRYSSLYAFQDIIRINEVWSEAKIVQQRATGQNWKCGKDSGHRGIYAKQFPDSDEHAHRIIKKIIPHKENLCSKYAEKMISIKINSVCNRKCDFCIDKRGHSFKRINLDKVISETIKLEEYKTVIITGGEPFLNFRSVIKLLKAIRHCKNRIVLNTNGSLLSKEKVSQLNGLIDELQISVHHYDEAVNGDVFGGIISFKNIKDSLAHKKFMVSINSTFNKAYKKEDRINAIDKMVDLAVDLGGNNLRLTELKMVYPYSEDFVQAKDFFPSTNTFANMPSEDLVANGCMQIFHKKGIKVSVKRLCSFAIGVSIEYSSCSYFDAYGELTVNVDTEQTYKVVYGDGGVFDSWLVLSDEI
jgi:MoaA/NifB/PqqE/SkfB family radical SAM enzyme